MQGVGWRVCAKIFASLAPLVSRFKMESYWEVLSGHHDPILHSTRTCHQDRCNFWCQFP